MLNLNFDNDYDIYENISKYDGNIYIWGTGSVGVGAKKELDKRNIKIAGFFTDVVNNNLDSRLEGSSVYLLDDLLKKGERFSVIIGHSHYELANKMKEYDLIDNVWALSMVARPDIAMDKEYIIKNIDTFNDTYSKLSDDLSKKNMENFLNVQLTKNGSLILENFEHGCTYFKNDVFELGQNEEYLDIGAYDGTSMNNFIDEVDGNYKKILALEVMKDMYIKLKQQYSDPRIQIINQGVSDHKGYDYFNFNDQSTCLTEENNGDRVEVDTIDNICAENDMEPTLIKLCIGNSILPIINGSQKVLEKLPTLVITAGIDKEALLKYVQSIENIVGKDKYDYYLRYTSAMAECLVYIMKPKCKIMHK